MSAKLIIFPYVFRSVRIIRDIPSGLKLSDVVEQAKNELHHPETVVFINDAKQIGGDCVVSDGDRIVIKAIPAGSNSDTVNGEKVWGGILAIIGAALLFVPGLQWLGASVLGAGISLFGAGIATNFVLNNIKFPSPANNASDPSKPSIHGARNSANPWGSVPVLLGKSIITPYYAAAPYTELQGDKQYLNLLFVLGYSPIDIISAQIGDAPIGGFTGVTLQYQEGSGNIGLLVSEQQFQIEVTQAGGPLIKASNAGCDRLSVDVSFPGGVCSYDSDGKRQSGSISVKVEYQVGGVGSWILAGQIDVTAATTSMLARNVTVDITHTSSYVNARITRLTSDPDDQHPARVYLTAVRNILFKEPLSDKAKSLVTRASLRIQATDQLNGTVDNFNVTAQSKVPTYSGSGSGASQWTTVAATSNPAALYLWCLRGPANARTVDDSQIDWPAFEAWYTWCAANSMECNSVYDGGGALQDILHKVASTGRATPSIRDSFYSIVHDIEKTVSIQEFTPRNSWGFVGKKTFVDLPHAYRVRFINAGKGYKNDERIVYLDHYGPATIAPGGGVVDGNGNPSTGGVTAATKFEIIDLWGVTDADQAYKMGRYQMANAILRPEVFSITVDIEHIACTRGDLVLLSHDVPLLGICAGRVKSRTLDGGGTHVVSITVDEVCTMDGAKTYAIRYRKSDGTIVYHDLTTVAGDNSTLLFVAPVALASAPEVGDLFSFGETSLETSEMLVVSIEPGDDLQAKIGLVNYNAAVYSADTETIPAFDSQVTAPSTTQTTPVTPIILMVQSDESVWLTQANGPKVPQILVNFAKGSALTQADHFDFWYRAKDLGGDWVRLTVPGNSGQGIITPAESSYIYQIQIRAVASDGQVSAWVATENRVTQVGPSLNGSLIVQDTIDDATGDVISASAHSDNFDATNQRGWELLPTGLIYAYDGLVTKEIVGNADLEITNSVDKGASRGLDVGFAVGAGRVYHFDKDFYDSTGANLMTTDGSCSRVDSPIFIGGKALSGTIGGVASAAVGNGTKFTIDFWFKDGLANLGRIFEYSDGYLQAGLSYSPGVGYYEGGAYASGYYEVTGTPDGFTHTLYINGVGTRITLDHKTHHVAIVKDTTVPSFKIYIDGSVWTGSLNSTGAGTITLFPASNRYFDELYIDSTTADTLANISDRYTNKRKYGQIGFSTKPLIIDTDGDLYLSAGGTIHFAGGACPLPIGFVYFQGPGDVTPASMYPGTTWANVSAEEAGTVRRAEGGLAAAFFTGTPATFTVSVSGGVPSIAIASGGSGYLNGGTGTIPLTITGTCSTQMVATATVAAGILTGINVTTPGAGYSSGAVGLYEGVSRLGDILMKHKHPVDHAQTISNGSPSTGIAGQTSAGGGGTQNSQIETNDGASGTIRHGPETTGAYATVRKWRRTS